MDKAALFKNEEIISPEVPMFDLLYAIVCSLSQRKVITDENLETMGINDYITRRYKHFIGKQEEEINV